jgi:hypothetical protein
MMIFAKRHKKTSHSGKRKRERWAQLLLLLTHRLVSFKLLHGLCRYALSAFVPPSVIPNLQKNSWCGQAIKQMCEWILLGGQHCQGYGFPTAMPNGGLPSAFDSLMAWSCCPNFILLNLSWWCGGEWRSWAVLRPDPAAL